jgi:uncharacterized protein (DUF3820 family)
MIKEIMTFGKYKGTKIEDVPLSYRCWYYSIEPANAKKLWLLTFTFGQRIWFGEHTGDFISELSNGYKVWLRKNVDDKTLKILFCDEW